MDKPRKPFRRQSGGPPGAKTGGPRAPGGGRGGAGAGRTFRRPLRPAHEGDAARERVFAALTIQARRFPDLDLFALDTSGLEGRDAAFAHAMYDVVIRRWLTLWGLIELKLNNPERPVPPKAIAGLLAGAAQILLLDKVPVHSAVDTAVEWTKGSGGQSASGLVNAVLRGLARLIPEGGKQRREKYEDKRDELPMPDGTALVLADFILPPDPVLRLSAATSHPVELLRTWTKHKGMREARRLALHGLMMPPVILNTAHASEPLPPECAPHNVPGHHVYNGDHAQLSALLTKRRDIWAQDPASSLAVLSVADLRPGVIIDACAGLGTKTRQLAATFPDAQIIASDVDLLRIKTLKATVESERIKVVPYQSLIDWAGKADLVLLDVPCSNTGVLPRRVEARYRFDRVHLDKLTALQRQIMADSIRLLKPKGQGKLLYSTCSLDPEENQEQAAWALRWHGFRIVHEHERAPEGLPGEAPEKYTDGSYAVLLE